MKRSEFVKQDFFNCTTSGKLGYYRYVEILPADDTVEVQGELKVRGAYSRASKCVAYVVYNLKSYQIQRGATFWI